MRTVEFNFKIVVNEEGYSQLDEMISEIKSGEFQREMKDGDGVEKVKATFKEIKGN